MGEWVESMNSIGPFFWSEKERNETPHLSKPEIHFPKALKTEKPP